MASPPLPMAPLPMPPLPMPPPPCRRLPPPSRRHTTPTHRPQIAGIIAGILQSADFPCEVSALLTRPDDGGTRDRTVYLIKFSPGVMDREERLEKKG